MTINIQDEELTLGAATAAILQHLYEAAQARGEKMSFDAFVDHVLMRGKAEIERQWKSTDKAAKSKAEAKVAAEQYQYLQMKQKRGESLSESEEQFLNLMKNAMKAFGG